MNTILEKENANLPSHPKRNKIMKKEIRTVQWQGMASKDDSIKVSVGRVIHPGRIFAVLRFERDGKITNVGLSVVAFYMLQVLMLKSEQPKLRKKSK